MRALGGAPPEGFNYELFLDEKGQKISKSKGNGLTIEEWLTYASPESLSLFMYQKPSAAKRLYFDVIPRTVDDYLTFLDAYPRQECEGAPRQSGLAHSFGRAAGAGNPRAYGRDERDERSPSPCCSISPPSPTPKIPQVLWGFLRRYAPDVSPANSSAARPAGRLCRALFPRFRAPGENLSRRRRGRARACCANCPKRSPPCRKDASAEDIQAALYDVARAMPRYQDLKAKGATPERPGVSNDWFNMLYEVLLGESRGPRFGSFVALYGVAETRQLIEDALNGAFVARETA